jgi:hypothetical protein
MSEADRTVMAHGAAGDRRHQVRQLAIETLRQRGVDVRPDAGDAPGDDRLVDGNGNHFWLYNLQLQCASLDVTEVESAVRFHFDQHFAAHQQPSVNDLTDAEFLARVRTRLVPPDASGMLSMNYARPAFDGLVAELSRDMPTTVHTVSDADVKGRDLDFVYQVGQANTDAEPATAKVFDNDVTALYGESFFIASKALNMSALVATYLGEAPLGVVFSVPYRSLLFIHPVGATTREAVGWIASTTLGQTQDAPGGPVSRDTYYWFGDSIQPVTRIDHAARTVEIVSEGRFGEALRMAVPN